MQQQGKSLCPSWRASPWCYPHAPPSALAAQEAKGSHPLQLQHVDLQATESPESLMRLQHKNLKTT
jgi:hypothetical protein